MFTMFHNVPLTIKNTNKVQPFQAHHRQSNSGVTFLYSHNLNACEMFAAHEYLYKHNSWCYVINASKFKSGSTAPRFEGVDFVYTSYTLRPYCIGGMHDNTRSSNNPYSRLQDVYLFEDAELLVIWANNKPSFYSIADMDESIYETTMKDILRYWKVETVTLRKHENEEFFEDMGIDLDKTRFLRAYK